MKKLVLIASFALLSGCLQTVVETTQQFDPNSGRYILANGSGEISGQAFMRQQGGGVVTCAGEEVALMPATAYQQERMAIIFGNTQGGVRTSGVGNVPPARDPRAKKLERTTICDAEGDFVFSGLAAGDYYVGTRVQWRAGNTAQGGALAKRVKLKSGQKTRVLLN